MTAAATPAASYDPFSYESREDPYPAFRRLRDEAPLYRNSERDFWALSRFSDVQAAARDWQTYSSAGGVDLDRTDELFGPGNFIAEDPAIHGLLRDVVRRTFSPRAVQGLEPLIRDRVTAMLAALRADGGGDAAQGLTWPLPVEIISRLLGLPPGDDDELRSLFHTSMSRELGKDTMPEHALEAAIVLRDYFTEAVERRQRKPSDDLLSRIVSSELEGEPIGERAVGMCFLLFSAGIDTGASFTANAIYLLWHAPEQRAMLREQPQLIPAGIEELLRYDAPVQYSARVTTAPVISHGQEVPVGSRVLLLFGAANRDDRRYERPDALDVSRTPKRHLGFGEGIHHCLGAPLARLEAKVLLEELLAIAGDYEVHGIERMNKQLLRGISKLDLTL